MMSAQLPPTLPPLALSVITLGAGAVAGLLIALLRSRSGRRAARADVPASAVPFVIPRELPPPPVPFVGRTAEVGQVERHLGTPTAAGPRLVAITGDAGMGKSALAVHVAHLVADRFPGGHLYARTDWFSGSPRTEGVADPVLHGVVGAFVRALLPPGEEIPAATGDRVDRLAELTAELRVLMVIDDVTDPALLEPFRRVGAGCGIVVTSRAPLDGLDWAVVRLEPLSDSECIDLLGAIVGPERIAHYRRAAEQIVLFSAHHPLALRLAGTALANAPYRDLALAVDRIRPLTPARITGAERFAGALDLSYALLPVVEQRALRQLGLLEGPDFAPWMLAKLIDEDEETAERIADRLVRAGLVERVSTDLSGIPKYRMLDRVKDYAATRLGPARSVDDSDNLEEVRRERRSRAHRSMDDILRDDVFMDLEQGRLTDAVGSARRAVVLAREQADPRPTGLAMAALAELQVELGNIADAVELAQEALRTANPRIRVRARRSLGRACRSLRQLRDAEAHLDKALVAVDRAGSERVRVLSELAVVRALGTDPASGEPYARQALELCRRRDDAGRQLLPRALWAYGVVLTGARRPADARRELRGAAEAAEAAGLSLWRSWIAHQAGVAALADGDLVLAEVEASDALTSFAGMRHRYGAAHARLLLGRISLASGRVDTAAQVLEDALETFRNCGDRWAEATTGLELAGAWTRVDRVRDAAEVATLAARLFADVGDESGSRNAEETMQRLDACQTGGVTAPAPA